MQLVLVGAAVVSIVALEELSTGLVILGLTVLNAVLGLNQEGKAAESVAALQRMLVSAPTCVAAAPCRTSRRRSSSPATS
jgi:Ca2+-transporting ATPase